MATPQTTCPHGGRWAWGNMVDSCGPCVRAARDEWKAAWKAKQLADHPCAAGCGRPRTFTLAGVPLCGRCKTKAQREHNRKVGALGIFILAAPTSPADILRWAQE